MPPPKRPERADPEYLARFEREMRRRRELPPKGNNGDDDGGASAQSRDAAAVAAWPSCWTEQG